MSRALFAVLALFLFTTLHAQGYPARPIRLVVPFPPGGSVDLAARFISEKMSEPLGQPFVIETRAGAGGAIAEEFVSRAAPDGYTLLFSVGSDTATRKYLLKRRSIDPLKDLTPIATAVLSVNVIAAGPGRAASSLKDFIAQAKRNPGKLTVASGGLTSYHHLIAELLRQNGVDVLYVPYKGIGPAMIGLLGGETHFALAPLGIALPHLKEGKVQALAVVEPSRYAGAPDIPSVSEELPAFKAPPSWFGFFGPADLPQPIVVRLNAEVNKALESPEVSAKIKAANVNPLITPLERLRPFILETDEAFGSIIKAAGIQPSD
jgi:tripartite-type tricarboxylate transporter receptor subunit TctC